MWKQKGEAPDLDRAVLKKGTDRFPKTLEHPLPRGSKLGSLTKEREKYSSLAQTACPQRMGTLEEVARTVASSSVAGFVARAVCHPLDTAKTRIQAPGKEFRGTLSTLNLTLRQHGLAGLYRGFAAVAVGGVPATALYLTSYDASKKSLEEAWPGSANVVVHLSAGLFAEAVSCVVFVPVDVIKERLQVGAGYKGSWDALRTISREEGLRGMYRGYAATLGSFGPFSAVYFAFYEEAKATTLKQLGPEGSPLKELPSWAALWCASMSGAAAAWLTSPLDRAKLYLQLERLSDQKKRNSFAGALGSIVRNEGALGLWRGSLARMAFTAPNTAITMAVFERVRAAI